MLRATCTKTWGQANTIELTSWLVHIFCDFKATWHHEASVSLEYIMKIHLADIFYFLVKALPPSSHYSLGIFIFCYTFYESATLRALRAHVPTCLPCLRAQVPTCLTCLSAHLPTCLPCLRAHAPTCLTCLSAHLPMCLACLHAHVPTCLAWLRAHVPCVLTCQRA